MNTLTQPTHCQVLVAGSGAGALLAANHAHDLGLKVMVIEKSDRYGGTSAMSGGGIWIPNNRDIGDEDSFEKALTYMKACIKEQVDETRLVTYLRTAPEMVEYMREKVGVRYTAVEGYADYCQYLPGAVDGKRTMFADAVDAGVLGDDFFALRQPDSSIALFGRIAMDFYDSQLLGTRGKGWKRRLFSLLWNYWSDLGWRRKTRRDRRVTMGAALVAGLRIGLMQRKVPLLLRTRLVELLTDNGRVCGAVVEHNGNQREIHASHAVILGTGGFEQNQTLRSQYLPAPTSSEWSITARNCNTGDALLAGQKINAATEFLNQAWWGPTIRLPAANTANTDMRHCLFFERGYPHSLCVNRIGKRFANEAMSYNDFGHAMLADQKATGANVPCWFIFDATYRKKFVFGRIMPSSIMPDSKLPPEWWDTVLYRADSIAELAKKIDIDPNILTDTINTFNGYARSGVDADFNRGHYSFDRFYCPPEHKPNASLGILDRAPFYAIALDLGDLGTKGGLKFDVNANVLDTQGQPIPGLYAIGNVAGSMMADTYPGAGATLGPALVFGYLAAKHAASQNQVST